MSWTRIMLATIGLSSACAGIAEPDFIETWEPAFCAAYVTCASDEMLRAVNVRECLEHLRLQDYPAPPECKYDRKAAEACAAAMSEPIECSDNDPTLPAVCADVYSGCLLPRVPAEHAEG